MKKTWALIVSAVAGIVMFSGCAQSPPAADVVHVYPPSAGEVNGHYSLEVHFSINASNVTYVIECAKNEECQNLERGQHITFDHEPFTGRLVNVRVANDTPASR